MGHSNQGERFKSEPWVLSCDANYSMRFPLMADQALLPTKAVPSSYIF